jgi:hypothetical protein
MILNTALGRKNSSHLLRFLQWNTRFGSKDQYQSHGQLAEFCKVIKKKIDAGVYEPSNASYRSKFVVVLKKDGKSIWLVHALEPLNAVTIAHSGIPPATDELANHFAG